MAPYYGPNEDEATILLERYLVAADFVCGVGFGIQLIMYSYCALYLWGQRRAKKVSLYFLAYITLLFSVETIFVIVQARSVQLMYIDNRSYPGGPWQYFLATQSLAINVVFYATLFLLTSLSDILVLWRCWAIWSSSGRRIVAILVMTFPLLMLLASFAMGTLWTLQLSQPGLSLYSSLPMAYGTSYYAVSLGLNIILTVLISLRLLLNRRSLIACLPKEHASHYLSLIAIIVESAAIYSLFAILFLITYAVDDPSNQVLLAFASSAQIATYLIIYRLAQGRAWDNDARTQETFASVRFQVATEPKIQRNIVVETETVEMEYPSSTPSSNRTVTCVGGRDSQVRENDWPSSKITDSDDTV